VLDRTGTIVAVDRLWRDTAQDGVPFGERFPHGACYPDLCECWGRPQAPALCAVIRAVLAGECVDGRVAYDLMDTQGERRRFEMRVARIDLNDSPHVLVLHMDQRHEQDLLERFQAAQSCVEEQTADLARQATDLIQAREQAVAFVRGKTDFMANLSHEILTPMNGIIGMTDLALETRSKDDQREYLLAVRSAANSLLTLFNNILDFSSSEGGQLILARTAFSLRDVVTETLDSFALRAREKGIDLRQELDPEVPDLLVGDPARLSQILFNVIDNAVKFTERGRVSVHAVAERVIDGKITVLFKVLDTGIGIDPSLHEEIFRSFIQADGSTTRRHGGTGLGLTIASQLATSMDSALHVKSRLGEGSTFSFAVTLEIGRKPSLRPVPQPDANPQAESPSDAGACGRGGLRILVAEDNPVSRSMARSALERLGHTVELVENGKDAVQQAVSERFDLVLMDIELPVLDGFGATALIREHEKGNDHHVPIVAMIGHGTEPDRERFRRAGMDDVLSKPFEEIQLDALLEFHRAESLAGRRPLDDRRLLEQSAGDPQVAIELISMFLKEREKVLEPIAQAIEECNTAEIERAAFKLTGKFGSLAAPRATEAAKRLERLGRVGDLEQSVAALAVLRGEVGLLENELRKFLTRRA
jgi:signal transduction histidine kinase/DNA-binding response OmpR family regulator